MNLKSITAKIEIVIDEQFEKLRNTYKIFQVAEDGNRVILRSDDKKGIKYFSLEDASLILQMDALHKKNITKLNLL